MLIPALLYAQPGFDGRNLVTLEGKTAIVRYDTGGGALVDFHLSSQNINPFTWNHPEKGNRDPHPMGHFICFDRWGQPSPGEEKRGMTYHGEAISVVWDVLAKPSSGNGKITAKMRCELPIGGMTLERTAILYENAPVLAVQEVITNIGKLGRVYNIVQHPSIAPPFLDETTIVDCNAWKGYMQESPWPNPEEPVIYWPHVAYKGTLVDLRRLSDNSSPGVTSFVFAEGVEYGWSTACNPGKRLLVGYIWKLTDYPWLNHWRNVLDNKPAARGLEFGTTGLHRPFGDMLAKGKIFGQPLCEYLDAGETTVKTYIAFEAEIPVDYKGVEEIVYREGTITLKERDSDSSRDITIKY